MWNPLLLLLLLAVVSTLIPLTESPGSSEGDNTFEVIPRVTPNDNETDSKPPKPQTSPPTANTQPDPTPESDEPQQELVSSYAAPAPSDTSKQTSGPPSTSPSPHGAWTTPELWNPSPGGTTPSPSPQYKKSTSKDPDVIHYVYQPAIRDDEQSPTNGSSYDSAGQPLQQDMRNGTLSTPNSLHGATPSPPATNAPFTNDTSLHMSAFLIIMHVIMFMLVVAVISALIVVVILLCPRIRYNEPLHQSANTVVLSPKSIHSTHSSDTVGRPTPSIQSVGTATSHQYNKLSSVRNNRDNYAIPVSVPIQQSYPTYAQYSNEGQYEQQKDSFVWASAVEPGKNQTIITSNPTYISARESVGDLSLFAQTTSTKRTNKNPIHEEYQSPLSMSSLGGCSGMSDISACVDYRAADVRPRVDVRPPNN
uniref:AlNc14C3G404 protein n=1 Tax=Albugo laibachii Nc14 TaxID=890382 RepID=F0VZS5_9STRA|nr:AlNc14C3G404 [Albugo laibachii Nc14]|eukprot:CCA14296.1 AlNc14C3G404 [Albugo laibachii Nc14]